MNVTISQASTMMAKLLTNQLVPMIKGSPGCGKSQSVYQLAKKYKLKVIDLRLAQCDPCDLAGFPLITGDKADYLPMTHFPIEGDKVPEGYEGWLLFLDEINSAPPSIQAAAYKLILDRQVGSHHLHKRVAVVAAGNLETDNAVVTPMPTALQSRMVHLTLVVDKDQWIEWAGPKGIDHRIVSYIKFKPGALMTFDPDHSDDTYACPRTWEFASRLLATTELSDSDLTPLLSGTLSEGVAREFLTFCSIYKDLPTLDQILNQPLSIKVSQEPSVLYALTGTLAHNATKKNFDKMMAFTARIPAEFQVVMVKEALRRNPEIAETTGFEQWVESSAATLF